MQLKHFLYLAIDIPYMIYIFLKIYLKSLYRKRFSTHKSLNGEIILVTGAASGIGQAVVWKLAQRFPNAKFVLWDVNETGLQETLKKCKTYNAQDVHTFTVDVSKSEDVFRTASLVQKQVGEVTILYNNAGICNLKPFLDCDHLADESIMKINYLGCIYTLRAFLPQMLQRRKGHLVTTCSIASLSRTPFVTPSYVASKHALKGFLDCLKVELKEHPQKPNIKFTSIFPSGVVGSPMSDDFFAHNNKITYRYPMVVTTVDYVAEEVVEGIIQEKEDVYVPAEVSMTGLVNSILPLRFIREAEKLWLGIGKKNA